MHGHLWGGNPRHAACNGRLHHSEHLYRYSHANREEKPEKNLRELYELSGQSDSHAYRNDAVDRNGSERDLSSASRLHVTSGESRSLHHAQHQLGILERVDSAEPRSPGQSVPVNAPWRDAGY